MSPVFVIISELLIRRNFLAAIKFRSVPDLDISISHRKMHGSIAGILCSSWVLIVRKECGADAGGVEGNNNKCADKKFRSERMIEEIGSSHIHGMVDLDQMTYAEESIDDYMDNLGAQLVHVHFNDRGHTVPGDGDFPMKKYYKDLKRRGYEGTISFEICDRRYYCDPDKVIDDITEWLRNNTTELS